MLILVLNNVLFVTKKIIDNHLLPVYVKKDIMIPIITNLIIYVFLYLYLKNMNSLNGNGLPNLHRLKKLILKKEEII